MAKVAVADGVVLAAISASSIVVKFISVSSHATAVVIYAPIIE